LNADGFILSISATITSSNYIAKTLSFNLKIIVALNVFANYKISINGFTEKDNTTRYLLSDYQTADYPISISPTLPSDLAPTSVTYDFNFTSDTTSDLISYVYTNNQPYIRIAKTDVEAEKIKTKISFKITAILANPYYVSKTFSQEFHITPYVPENPKIRVGRYSAHSRFYTTIHIVNISQNYFYDYVDMIIANSYQVHGLH
jgi:hypothetical protein